MDDLISSTEALNAIDGIKEVQGSIEQLAIKALCWAAVKTIPHTVDAVPVVHGRWKDNGNGTVSCNCCATWFPKTRESQLLFCGYCGAKMDE